MTLMNSIVKEDFEMIHGTLGMRNQILDVLTDADLSFKVPGNPTLGELFVNVGEVQHSYNESFKTFTQDWSYRNTEAGLSTSIAKLRTWFAKLDADFDAAINPLSDDEVTNKMIERGFPVPPKIQVQILVQALLIFYAKVVVYFNAMGKPLTDQLRDWIA
jgi:hypothetical protein